MLFCTPAINIHHFIVDRGIWRLRRDAANRMLVAAEHTRPVDVTAAGHRLAG